MLINRILAAVLAVGVTAGAIGAATVEPTFAATTTKHHVIVCKPGYVKHLVKRDGHWIWLCHKVHHITKLKIKLPMKPIKPIKPIKPKGKY